MTTKQFNRLSDRGKRLALAKDLLLTLAKPGKQRFTPTPKEYCTFRGEAVELIKTDENQQLQDLLPKIEKHCEACAMGGFFLSHIRLADHVTAAEAHGVAYRQEDTFRTDDNQIERTLDYFDTKQLRTIEAAFEGHIQANDVFDDNIYTGDLESEEDAVNAAAKVWVRQYPSSLTRLRKIADNIIVHKGDFDIHDLPTRKKKAA